ncbi:MAG: T9SS type A sorting domain-containing protein [Aureispira sp.]|nr:T9SS type A sorting domain-containing protein [Aureispira sp.]
MKSFSLLILLFLTSIAFLQAKPVDELMARKVAKTFYLTTPLGEKLGAANIHLQTVDAAKTVKMDWTTGKAESLPLFYVFAVNTNDGFVIVSGDDRAEPVLGYSNKGTYVVEDVWDATNFAKWMENYREELRYVINNGMEPSDRVKEEWAALMEGRIQKENGRSPNTVNPLMSTTWNQNPYYNYLCPSSGGQTAVTGCVATAMAQVMKYHAHPTQGAGSHTYNHSTYGSLSGNFGAATYDWSSMPNNVTSNNFEVGQLMSHCGIAVEMDYSPSGSGAYSSKAADALKNYFGYKSSLAYVSKDHDYNGSTTSWKNMLKTELDGSRPLYYAGTGSGGGHAFVCDGYDASDKFHFNWGWGGAYDGFFSVTSLDPSGVGTGGGSGGFNSNHRVIKGIEPDGGGGGGGSSTYDLRLYSDIALSFGSINYGGTDTIKVDVGNYGNNSFSGDFAAILFDGQNNQFGVMSSTGQTITNGYFKKFTFLTSTLANNPTPGTYTVGLYYRLNSSSNWQLMDAGSYTNTATLNVVNNTGTLSMYNDINVSVDPIVQNQAFDVTVYYSNTGSDITSPEVSVDLFDVDLNFVTTVKEVTLQALPNGNAYYTFNSSGVSVDPGSYYLAAFIKESGGSWTLVGSTSSYPNPISVTVVAPGLAADSYESNDTEGNAKTLPTSFAANPNYATTGTDGTTNIHTGGDLDFYKVELPAGDSYSISSRVHDSYSSGNGQTYTNDVIYSYTINGGTASDVFDTQGDLIQLPNGGTVIFQVAPYYQGEKGSYHLSMEVGKGTNSKTISIEQDLTIQLFPNPVSDYLNIDLGESFEEVQQLDVFSAIGQKVYEQPISAATRNLRIVTTDWAAGVYNVVIQKENVLINRKIEVSH